MATFIGFSTVNATKPRTVNPPASQTGTNNGITDPTVYGKKFKLTDEKLVIQDLVNALNIRRGEKPGMPNYGTTLWDFVFDPNTTDVSTALKNEVRRVANQDPRIAVNTVRTWQKDNGILIEMQISIKPFNNVGQLALWFDELTSVASLGSVEQNKVIIR